MRTTIHGKLVAAREDFYSTYIFQNLDEQNNSLLRYISTTKPPNWTGTVPEIGDIGFVECEYVDAGEEYYQRNTGKRETYQYTQCYFINFVKEKEKIKTTDYKFE